MVEHCPNRRLYGQGRIGYNIFDLCTFYTHGDMPTMRWTQTVIHTRRERPDAPLPGLAYLLQANIIRVEAAGIYDWPPLGRSLYDHLIDQIHALLDAQSIPTVTLMPWRSAQAIPPLDEMPSSSGGPTPAAWYTPDLTALLADAITSYKHLPRHLATIAPVFRAESRPRAGLLRVRAFTLAEGISLAADIPQAHRAQAMWLRAWEDILRAVDLPVVRGIRPDPVGYLADAFLWPHESADTEYLYCSHCNRWYHPDVAPFLREPAPVEEMRPVQKVATPQCATIEDLCAFLDVPPQRTAKAMFLVAGEKVGIIAVVRGDTDLSLAKLRRLVGPVALRAATKEEIRSWGAEPGYGSPIGTQGAMVVVDALVAETPNLVAGANEPGYQLLNTNVGRAYTPHVVGDIARAPADARCPVCGTTYERRPAWVLASVTHPFHPRLRVLTPPPEFASALKDVASPLPVGTYLNAEGRPDTPWLVRAALGMDRVIAAVAETHHDDQGLTWPSSLAPCDVHLVLLPARKDPSVAERAQHLYEELERAGFRVLFDDREERAGVKFNDADLIGCPVRVTISARTLKQESVEVKPRTGSPTLVPLQDVVQTLQGKEGEA